MSSTAMVQSLFRSTTTGFYTGIGSRDTPADILQIMRQAARFLARHGYILRSGHAPGADLAHEEGAGVGAKEIYLPWRGFNGSESPLYLGSPSLRFPASQALQVAAMFHPAWDRCSDAARKLHARNVPQVLGLNLATPARFVLCWTKDGQASGGTGQALRIAAHHGVPILNLHDAATRAAVLSVITEGNAR